MRHGFIKTAAGTPKIQVADCVYNAGEILKLIEEVNRKFGNTVIMVTHNDAIKLMADRVVKLRDGMIRKNYLNEHRTSAAELEW